MMLEYSFNLAEEAQSIEQAVDSVLSTGYRTADIYTPGTQKVSTDKMGDLIVDAIKK